MKWYFDECVSPAVSEQLRSEYGIEAASSHDVGMNGTSDDAQLRYATNMGCILVTFNVVDYVRLAHLWAQRRESFRGIGLFHTRIVPQGAIGLQVRAVAARHHGPPWPSMAVEFLSPPERQR